MAKSDESTSIEGVLQNVLGFTLGVGEGAAPVAATPGATPAAAPAKATIAADLTPDGVLGGANRWFVVADHNEFYKASWHPTAKVGSIIFWRHMGSDIFSNWEYVRVQITDQGSIEPTKTSTTEQDKTDHVRALGTAWNNLSLAINKLTGPGTPMDNNTVLNVAHALTELGTFTDKVQADLANDISALDTKKVNFQGSAAGAFRERVLLAKSGVDDVKAGLDPISKSLIGVADKAKTFIETLQRNNTAWRGEAPNKFVQPLQLIISALNESIVHEVNSAENHRSGDLMDTTVHGADSPITDTDSEGNSTITGYKVMAITFPLWTQPYLSGDYDVLKVPTWDVIDLAFRTMWVDNLKKAFADSITAANQLITAIDAAVLDPAMTLTAMKMPPPPKGLNLDPLGEGLNNIANGLNGLGNSLGNGLNGLGNSIGNSLNGLGNSLGNGLNGLGNSIGNSMNGLGNSLGNGLNGLGNGLNGIGNGLNGLGNSLGNGLNGLGNSLGNNLTTLGSGLNGLGGDGSNGLGNGLTAGIRSEGPLINPNTLTTEIGGSGLGGSDLGGGGSVDPQTLGDLTPEQLGGLQSLGLLDDTPLTDQERAALDAAGLGAGTAQNLGDLTPAQLGALQSAGLLNSVPLTSGQTSGLQQAGLLTPGQGLDDLGDLSPAQLGALRDAGLLDSTPLTDQDLAELRRLGLVDSTTGGLSNLGDLNQDQLTALQDAGLLDDVPLTQQDLSALDAAGLVGATDGSVQNLGDLSRVQLATLDSAGQLDNIPVSSDQLAQLQHDGLLGTDTTGLNNLGDLSPAQLEDLRAAGLLDSVPVTAAELSTLDAAGQLGTPSNLSQSLGNLTPTQLSALDTSGLLDGDVITPDQVAQLQQDGLLGTDVGGINSLGDLTPAQLNDLSSNGLLDSVPTTPEQLTSLGVDGLPDPNSISALDTNTLGGPTTDFDLGSRVPSSAFPTNVDGFDITPVTADTPGVGIGDLGQPVSKSVPGTFGGGGGINSGGLSLPDGIDSTAGLPKVSSDPFESMTSSALGSQLPGSTGVGASSGTSALSSAGSGMPMMPPMGGGGMGGGQGKDRERNTWLTEDEDVWGTDPDCAPAVIGRGHSQTNETEPEFEPEVQPERPGGPARRARRGN